MKRISSCNSAGIGRRFISDRLILMISMIFILSGCSWITSRQKIMGEEDAEKKSDTVTRAQYDDLKRRYEVLLQEKRIEKAGQGEANKLANELEQGQEPEPGKLVNELSQVKDSPELAETVDVFSKEGAMAEAAATLPNSISGTEIEGEIRIYRNAEKALAENKFDASLTELKKIENSKIRQVKVRAKFLVGEIMFRQQEFDLAMQVYEEILKNHAFSGVVLKVLGRLIVCSEKLQLKKKQEQYYSMLHNFFES